MDAIERAKRERRVALLVLLMLAAVVVVVHWAARAMEAGAAWTGTDQHGQARTGESTDSSNREGARSPLQLITAREDARPPLQLITAREDARLPNEVRV